MFKAENLLFNDMEKFAQKYTQIVKIKRWILSIMVNRQ